MALSETDHLEEYDHDDPESGGLTESASLQMLCREHHRLKTLDLLDPVRDDQAGTTWWNVSGMLLAAQEDGREGWRVALDGDLNPPCEPPPY